MGKSPRPICDVCNKKVEQMDIEMFDGTYLYITVSCHGRQERYVIASILASQMNADTKIGRVFIKPKELNER